jgi:hypothetical protein
LLACHGPTIFDHFKPQVKNYNKGKVGEHPSSLGTRKVNFFFKLFFLCNGVWKITNPQAFEVGFG